MSTRTKENLFVVICGIILFSALMNISSLFGFLGYVLNIFLPIIIGAIIALFLSVPVNGMHKRLVRWTSNMQKRPTDSALRKVSIILVIIIIILIVALVFGLLIPQLAISLSSSYELLQVRIPEWVGELEQFGVNEETIEEIINSLDITRYSDSIDKLLSTARTTLSSTISVISNAGFGLIIGIYLTVASEMVNRHARKFIDSFCSEEIAKKLYSFSELFYTTFSNFLTGQCLEAVILGVLMFVAFTIFRLPYAVLVGVITAFCAIIPYIGAFISLTISLILTLLVSPQSVLYTAAVYLIVQFIENQFIYPRVVGGSVGMPPLYTLIAAMIGGKLFGVFGIIFAIPLMAVLIEVIKRLANDRLEK